MPKIRTSRTKAPPEGFDEIEETLLEFDQRLKDSMSPLNTCLLSHTVKTTQNDIKKKNESLWPVFQINHQRSRYIYDLYYNREAISTELYQWLLKQNYADANLIARWKKQGYEKLCCLKCIATKETNFGTACICRVPKAKLAKDTTVECVHCKNSRL
jgi:bud site selection protein 31